jgi:hypothetical protein
MLIDGVIVVSKCPSPPRVGGAHRAVIAASRFWTVGTQVVASAGRFSWNVSRTVRSFRDFDAVPETRCSSRRQLSAPVAACFTRSRGAGSLSALRVVQSRPAPWTHLTNCCSRRLTPSPVRFRGQSPASSAAERHRYASRPTDVLQSERIGARAKPLPWSRDCDVLPRSRTAALSRVLR